MVEDLKKMYRTIMDDRFPPRMEISFVDGKARQTLLYDKVSWVIDGVEKGLRWRGDPRYREVRYEDLVQDPIGKMRQLYAQLGLGGFEQDAPRERDDQSAFLFPNRSNFGEFSQCRCRSLFGVAQVLLTLLHDLCLLLSVIGVRLVLDFLDRGEFVDFSACFGRLLL